MVSLAEKQGSSHLTPANSLSPSMVRHKDDGYSEEKDMKTCPWDSGYDSLSNRLSILDRLLHTHPIWLQLSLSEEGAAEVLRSQPPGVRLRISRKQFETSRAAAFLKRKTWSSRKFFPRLYGAWCLVHTWVAMQGDCGKYGGSSKEKSPFMVCLSVFISSVTQGGLGLSRITGHLG